MDNDIQVSFNPGAFITADEAHQLIGAMVESALTNVVQIDEREGFTLPKDGWKKLDAPYEGYDYCIEIADETITAKHQPEFVLDLRSYDTAVDAGLAPSSETEDGKILFWAVVQPEKDITGTLTLTYKAEVKPDIDIGSRYVLPPATSTDLGGVIVGDGLNIDEDGRLSVNKATDKEVDDKIDDIFNPDSGGGDEDDEPGALPDGYTIATNEEVAAKTNSIFGF